MIRVDAREEEDVKSVFHDTAPVSVCIAYFSNSTLYIFTDQVSKDMLTKALTLRDVSYFSPRLHTTNEYILLTKMRGEPEEHEKRCKRPRNVDPRPLAREGVNVRDDFA
jgi:hypothetical protein